MVSLGEILERQKDQMEVQDLHEYARLRIRMNGRGIDLRDRVLGSEIGTKRQFVAKAGQLVLSKIDARNGAFGILPSHCDQAIITGNFWAFEIEQSRLDAQFFEYFTKTKDFLAFCIRASEGTTNRRYLQEPQFLRFSMPLPPIQEQRCIVEKMDSIHKKVLSVNYLINKTEEELQSLLVAYINGRLKNTPHDRTVGEVLIGKPRNGWSARCDNVEGGMAVLSLGAVSGFEYRASHHKLTSEATEMDAHYWLREGDLLMTRSNTPELVGHAAIYNGHPFPCIYPDLMMRLEVNESLADKRFLHRWLMSTTVREFIRHAAKGTSPTMKKISQGVVMQIPFPRLSQIQQGRLADDIEAVGLRIQEASRLQNKVAVGAGAAMPSILNHAFSGQL